MTTYEQLDLFAEPIGPPSGAVFSPCRRYRYRLWRRWNQGPAAVFVMLNPSTADEHTDDPTIRKCIGYAQQIEGCGGLVVVNLFAWRATDPRELRVCPDPVGPENDRHLLEACRETPFVVAAWGEGGTLCKRDTAVVRLLNDAGALLYALKVNKGGAPGHPLYLRGDAGLRIWRSPTDAARNGSRAAGGAVGPASVDAGRAGR